MPQYTTKDIASIINGSLTGNTNSTINNILTDSRNLATPNNSAFFAIKGKHHDGHDYIEALYQKDVLNFVVSQHPDLSKYPNGTFIKVNNVLDALQDLAAFNRKNFKNPLLAITGSNGKTIVKEWLFQALTPEKNIIRSPKSYNSQVGVPLSLWLLSNEADMAIIEAGISQTGEMQKLQKIIGPDIGMITNIGEAHQENFTSHEQKAEEKLKLFHDVKTIIYCKDHSVIDKEIKKNKKLSCKNLFTWSQYEDADLHIKSIEATDQQTIIKGYYHNKAQQIIIPFKDHASIENSIHVWASLCYLGYDQKTIANKLAGLSPVAMRLEMKSGINNCTLINDSYNSDLVSLRIALDFLSQQNQHEHKTIVLSDIYQSGHSEDELYGKIAEVINGKKIDKLIGIGDSIMKHQDYFKTKKLFFSTTEEFIKNKKPDDFNNEAILIKGSRNFHFENIVVQLEQKIHRTVLEINLNALTHNLNYFRSLLKTSTRLMVMVKASSYGSGSYEVANLLQHHRADYLGVAFADEGIHLREAGIQLPIMIMNPEEGSYGKMIEYKLEPEIYSFEELEIFARMAKQHGELSYPVHLKLDTGMHRLGFTENEIPELIKKLISNKHLKIKSVFSHLSASDEKKHDTFTKKQITLFDLMSKKITSSIGYTVIRHILNSGGIERFPHAQFDMVRLGIGLYGISAVDKNKVLPISRLKSHIIQIKNVTAGETIGYGRKGMINRDTKIAVIPIGYADGLNRKLSNGVGKILINEQFAPVIGNICMDMCMVDITGIDASIGDEAIIFGHKYTISDMAGNLDTIPYEILTGISERVKRVYYQE